MAISDICEMRRFATTSEDGLYRTWLVRKWDVELPTLYVVMLNPSTADGTKDDQTVRRLIFFATLWGFGAVCVANLFTFRATQPGELYLCADPFGPDRDRCLENAVQGATVPGSKLVVAWGANRAVQDFAAVGPLGIYAGRYGVPLYCFGKNADGSPKHPCRLPNSTELERWR